MRKKKILEGTVVSLAFPNVGTVEAEGERYLVKGVLPGQRVRFALKKRREGTLLSVLESSPEEGAASCPAADRCGGCFYRTLSYEKQLSLKEQMIRGMLEPFLPQDRYEGILPSPCPDEYRNKMEFSFGDAFKEGPLSLGMHRKGSFYDIVTADCCRNCDGDFRAVLSAVLSYAQERDLSFYHKTTHEGLLRHLLVRKGAATGEILVALVTVTGAEARTQVDREAFVQTLVSLPLDGKISGILWIGNDSVADVIRPDETEIWYGQDSFTDQLFGMAFTITPFSFCQTNTRGAEVLYDAVRRYAGEDRAGVLFDLYCGTGTITQILSPIAGEAVGVEIVPEAVEAARENARRNGLTNVRFLCGDVLAVLDTLAEKPDLIILDPPREGVHPKAVGKIIRYGVDRIIYVSCKPTSLVRDLAAFAEGGYEAECAVSVDMFPWTTGIETVVRLVNRNKENCI